jgi:polyphosphate:AMP phosphotransferase
MFETLERAQPISRKAYRKRASKLRADLLEAQVQLQEAGSTVMILFAGVDGAGKGETANLLQEWMDPHFMVTRAFDAPSQEERERPEFWRYWRDLPPKGHIALYLSAWYSPPLLDRVYERSGERELDRQLDKITSFETTLASDGVLILKFWMHLDKPGQRRRFEQLEADPLLRWRVTEKDWTHWRMYDRFVSVAERIIGRTSSPQAPWTIVDGSDPHHYGLKVGELLLEGIQRHLAGQHPDEEDPETPETEEAAPITGPEIPTIFAELDLDQKLPKPEYEERLEKLQGHLNLLHRRAYHHGVSTALVFEGWDAAGKGGAIRRVTAALDARRYEVIRIAAPTDEEKAHHYLWRFWRHLSRGGRFSIYDRSWYGRVLVERVEGFAREDEWRRAYAEINEFESQLVEHGIALVKFWVHISKEEQQRRFEARRKTPYKRWKLTPEDWRNRERWDQYETAVDEMIRRTDTERAPWVVVEGDDKRFARIKVLQSVCSALQEALV